MPINTKENFDYENYARTVFQLSDEEIGEINQQQKDLIYNDAINNVHELNQKTFKGKSNKSKAIRETLNAFEGAREVLGVPDEVDADEPYRADTLSGFLNQIHESNRDISAEKFLDKYANEFYDDEFIEFKRPFLQDIDKKIFKERLVNKFEDIDFDEPVSNVLAKLEQIRLNEQNGLDTQSDTTEQEILNKDGAIVEGAKKVGDFLFNIGVGLNNAIVDTGTGAIRILDSAGRDLAENITGDIIFDYETESFHYLTPNELQAREGKLDSPLSALADIGQEKFRIDSKPETFVDKLAQGGGQLISILLGGGVTKAITGANKAASAVATGMGITQGGESGYQDYVNTIEATGQKFDQRTANAAVQFNALIGASEAFPVLKSLDRLTGDGNVPVGTLLKRIDDATGNSVSKAFNKVSNTTAGNIVASGAVGAVEEGSQEIFQNMAQNLVANGILEYDPNRGFVNAETVEGGQIGSVLGGFTNALFAALTPRQRRQLHDTFKQQNEIQTPTEDTGQESQAQDQTGQTTISQTQGEIQPNIREVDSQVIASLNNRVGVGATQEEALAELESKNIAPSLRDDDDFEVETSIRDDGVQESSITTGDNDILFTGPKAEDQLNELIEASENGDPLTSIPKDLTIEQDGDNYLLNSGSVSVTSQDLQLGLAQLNSELKNISQEGRVFDVQPEVIPEPVVVPINKSGFHVGNTTSNLESKGFTLLNNPDKRVKNFVSRGGFRAYKDGFIYTVRPQKMGGVDSAGVTVDVEDLDGVKYRVPSDEVSQQFRQDGKIKKPVNQRTPGNEFVETVRGATGGIVLRQPAKGVILTDKLIAGEQRKIIDAQSIDEVADRINADIIFKSEDQTQVILQNRDTKESVEFAIDDDGNFLVNIDGQSIPFEGGFEIKDNTRSSELSSSVMTRELELNGYRVVSIDEKGINLVNGNNNTVTIPRSSKKGAKVVIDDQEFKVNEISDFRNILDIPDGSVQPPDNIARKFESRPDDSQMNRHKQQTLISLMDVDEDLSKSVVVDNELIFENEGGIRVVMDVRDQDPITTLEQVRTNSTTPTEFEILKSIAYRDEIINGNLSWTKEQLDNYLNLIPQEIRDIIRIHHNTDNPARRKGANGYFTPSDENNNPAIHIDGNFSDRSFNTVLGTIAEEVSHFGFESWFNKELDGLVDRVWALVGDSAIKNLRSYVERYNINVVNPSMTHKWVLINEFFSKQGTTFVDFDARSIDLPPGIKEQDLQQLKKDVDKTLQKVTIDLSKDFIGDQTDSKEFIMNILRLQASSTSNSGMHLTYKVARNDGTPATIEVRTTPYGSESTTSLTDIRAERIKKIARSLRESRSRHGENGILHKLKLQLYKNVYSFVDPVVGREISIMINAIHQPSISKQAGMLKEIKVEYDKVRALLDSHGVENVPITDSYHKTFVDVGITNVTDLKRAQRMDEFLRSSFVRGNQNVGSIRKLYRDSERLLEQMVGNHKGSAKFLSTWRRELRLQARRFTTDWDHRTYLAYQPGAEKALTVMLRDLDPLDGRKTLAAKAAEARQAKVEINTDQSLTPSQRASKLRKHNEVLETKKRLDKLRQWARDEVEARKDGTTVLGLMRSKIVEIMKANTNYHNESGGLSNEFISALKGRNLNENDSHDRLFMDFLGEVTDPLAVAIGNIEQQNKVLNQLMYTNKLAIALVDRGIARPIGSTDNIDNYTEGDTNVFSAENGGLLNFIEVDEILAEFIRNDVELNQALERNALGEKFLGKLITTVKSSKTILSPKLAVSNYTSNISLLLYGGHMAYINKYASAAKGIKSGWKQQVTFGYDKLNDNSIGDMIAREMVENKIFSGSVTSLDATLGNGQVIEQTLNAATSMLNRGGIVSKNAKIITDDIVNKFFEKLKRFYSFGDEYSKVLPYLVNRDIGMAMARAQIDRDNFANNPTGERKYEQAVLRAGIEIAADRTSRETTTWVIAPDFIKDSVRNKINFAIGDFVLHPTQMLRIMIENKRLLVEDVKTYRQAKKDGNTELATVMRNAVATRSISNTLIDVAAGSIALGGMGVIGIAIARSYSLLVPDDEEDTPVSERGDMTLDELQAFFQISNSVNYGWGGDPMYPIARDGYIVTYYNGKRVSAMNTLIPSAAPTFGDISTPSHLTEFLGNYLNFSNDSIAIQLFERGWKGVDRNGHDLSKSRRAEEIAKLITPGIIAQPYGVGTAIMDVIHDPTQDIGPRRGQELLEESAAFAGLRVVHMDIRDMVYNLGWTITNQTNASENTTLNDFKKRLTSGEELEIAEVRDLVKTMSDNNNEVMGYVNYGINAYRNAGLTNKEINKHLNVQTDGVTGPKSIPKDLIKDLLKGKNGFNNVVIGQLENLRKKHKNEAKASNKVSNLEIQNKIDALDTAIKEYRKYIKNNPR